LVSDGEAVVGDHVGIDVDGGEAVLGAHPQVVAGEGEHSLQFSIGARSCGHFPASPFTAHRLLGPLRFFRFLSWLVVSMPMDAQGGNK
jgi:hypothetical protein